jgi:hypothetical protein
VPPLTRVGVLVDHFERLTFHPGPYGGSWLTLTTPDQTLQVSAWTRLSSVQPSSVGFDIDVPFGVALDAVVDGYPLGSVTFNGAEVTLTPAPGVTLSGQVTDSTGIGPQGFAFVQCLPFQAAFAYGPSPVMYSMHIPTGTTCTLQAADGVFQSIPSTRTFTADTTVDFAFPLSTPGLVGFAANVVDARGISLGGDLFLRSTALSAPYDKLVYAVGGPPENWSSLLPGTYDVTVTVSSPSIPDGGTD